MPKKYVTIVEDYNVPLTPWYILLDKAFTDMSEGTVRIDSLITCKKDFAGEDAISLPSSSPLTSLRVGLRRISAGKQDKWSWVLGSARLDFFIFCAKLKISLHLKIES